MKHTTEREAAALVAERIAEAKGKRLLRATKGPSRRIPGLTAATWEGRRRRATVAFDVDRHCRDQEWDSIRINGVEFSFQLGVETEFPWPQWLELCRKREVIKIQGGEGEGGNVYKIAKGNVHLVKTKKPLFQVYDHGDVPGTEKLPESLSAWVQSIWDEENQLLGWPRAALMKLANVLEVPFTKLTFAERKEYADIELVQLIAEHVGLELIVPETPEDQAA